MIIAVAAGTILVLYCTWSCGSRRIYGDDDVSLATEGGSEKGVSIAWGVVFPVVISTRKTNYSFYGMILFLCMTN
jgi:hypothetical protein